MAVIPLTQSEIQGDNGPYATVVAWTPLANTDSGAPTSNRLAAYGDRSFQVSGTFGAGGTVLIEGSNDGVNWHVLNDPFGVAVSLTSAGIRQITEVVAQMRPRVSAGDANTAITVTGLLRRSLR